MVSLWAGTIRISFIFTLVSNDNFCLLNVMKLLLIVSRGRWNVFKIIINQLWLITAEVPLRRRSFYESPRRSINWIWPLWLNASSFLHFSLAAETNDHFYDFCVVVICKANQSTCSKVEFLFSLFFVQSVTTNKTLITQKSFKRENLFFFHRKKNEKHDSLVRGKRLTSVSCSFSALVYNNY